jgi:hypothetical protein
MITLNLHCVGGLWDVFFHEDLPIVAYTRPLCDDGVEATQVTEYLRLRKIVKKEVK